MKLILLICLVASAFAAPADRMKRNILPGDSRYDPEIHGNTEDHKNQETDDEISKALDDSTDIPSKPDAVAGSSDSGIGSDISGSTKLLNEPADESETISARSGFDQFADTKFSEELKSDVETNVALPKKESSTTQFSSTEPTTTDPFDQPSDEEKPLDDDKISKKTADESPFGTKFPTIFGVGKTTLDTDKTTSGKAMKPVTTDDESFTKFNPSSDSIFTSGLPSFSDASFVSTDFSSSIPLSSEFETFQHPGYHPSFDSSIGSYTPNFDSFDTSYQFNNNNYGYPLSTGTVSVETIPSQSFDFESTYSFPGIVSSSSFPTFDNFDVHTAFISPSVVGQVDEQLFGAGFDKDQLDIFKKCETPIAEAKPTDSVPPKQLTPTSKVSTNGASKNEQQTFDSSVETRISAEQPAYTSYQSSIQPAIKNVEKSFLGSTQLTDGRGGYVY